MPVAITWSLLTNEPDGSKAIVFNIQDLTEVKRIERQLRRSQRLAALGTMAAGIAHEIRNPLGGIRGASQLLAREMNENEKLKDFLDVIVREVDRLDQTVEQLLDLARPMKADTTPIKAEEIIDRSLAVLKAEIDTREICIRKSIPSQLRQIQADEDQLTQVFLNLFLNALQAMSKGGTLEIAAREDTGSAGTGTPSVVIEISDTGHGMSRQTLEHLFMPFYTDRENGTGLGLAITHKIVEEHGGTIDVVSEEGKGTTFTLSFQAS